MYTEDELLFELIIKCQDTNTKNVVLTGGNPCLYDFSKVINALHEADIKVDVETQGSKLPDWLDKVDNVVISPKAPSSGQPDVIDNVGNWLMYNPKVRFNLPVTIKIPVFNDEDFEFARRYYNLIQDIKLRTNRTGIKLYLNVGNTDVGEQDILNVRNRVIQDYEKLVTKVLESDMEDVYVMLQLHTLVWGNRQGV